MKAAEPQVWLVSFWRQADMTFKVETEKVLCIEKHSTISTWGSQDCWVGCDLPFQLAQMGDLTLTTLGQNLLTCRYFHPSYALPSQHLLRQTFSNFEKHGTHYSFHHNVMHINIYILKQKFTNQIVSWIRKGWNVCHYFWFLDGFLFMWLCAAHRPRGALSFKRVTYKMCSVSLDDCMRLTATEPSSPNQSVPQA